MLDLRTNAGFQSFDFVVYCIDTVLQVQLSSLAGSHRNMPSSRARLLPFFDALLSGVSVNIGFSAVQ
ncbi:hypothetical protein AWB82_06938 [Caballeronia glebae]|uniref:Uncharacterized protein n=1 Tax=Caballeronia glebae TaxID=1777143 RepID=A0A158DM25_9BURK|nr:hypothetical protein AWB82_06938 [Caballeronia glebae]